jgi:SAM-dependent methyltransferase
MNAHLLASKLVNMVRDEGLATAFRRAWARWTHSATPDSFDLTHGTDTSGLTPLWKLHIGSANARHGVRYEASTEAELVAAMLSLREPLEQFSFVDLGCGKGRTLLVAARLGFRRTIGVEFAQELVSVARANVRKAAAPNVTVAHADAADFDLPAGPLVVYLYNPFSEEVMRKVIANLGKRQRERLYVVYKGPRCAELLDRSGFLERSERPSAAPHIAVWRGVAGARAAAEAS